MNKLTMKTQQPYNSILFVSLLAGWIPISQAEVNTHSEASMSNVQINPSAGAINWTTDWKLTSTAEIKSSTVSDSAYDEDTGDDAETSVNISIDNGGITASAAAAASTNADISANTLNASTDAYLDDAKKKYVVKFAGSTLYREFQIIGGTGNVDVQFSYEYTAQIKGEADEGGHFEVDYSVILEVSDGANTQNIASSAQIEGTNTSITENYGGNLSDTFILAYDTTHYIILNVDPENKDEEPTLVKLLNFKAKAEAGGIKLEWATASERKNAGFHIWRTTDAGWKKGKATATKLTDRLIPAKGNKVEGASYTYTDTKVKSGVIYYYGLEDIEFSGKSTLHKNKIDSAKAK
jgi:hypothetical protein